MPDVQEPLGFTLGVLVTFFETPDEAGGAFFATALACAACDCLVAFVAVFALDLEEPDEPDEEPAEAGAVELAGVELAAPELPPPPPLTVTWIPSFFGVLEPDSPIRTPTPSASRSVAMPATSVALGDQLERRGGVGEGALAG